MLLQYGADRQEPLQGLDLGERGLELQQQALALLLCLLAFGDVPRDRVDDPPVRVGRRIPQEPSVRPVLAQVAVLEGARLSAAADVTILRERAGAIVRVHELDERLRHQLFAGESERALPTPD